MKSTLSAGLCALLIAGASLMGGYAQANGSLADFITSAVANPARPEGDRNRDVARKPVESLQFSGVKPADAVADFNASVDIAAFNKGVFEALKPGGSYVILDHTAAPGATAHVTETLHRIDPATVSREVQAAGFVFDSESVLLANPADPRTIRVFDKSIQGHTDQFILKFRRPQCRE